MMFKTRYTLFTNVVFAAIFVANRVQLANATIVVISKTSNETVFSAEEIGIDAASAYDLRGNLIIADPLDACTDVRPPPPRNHTIILQSITSGQQRRDSWILWATYNVSNDKCSLSRKAKEAEYAGYSAIIITVYGTNDTSGILPSFMGFDWMGIRIYTSILGENMGSTLPKYAFPNEYYLVFTNEPYFQLGLLVNFVFLGCLGVVIVVILLRLFHCLYMKVSTSVQERRRKRKAYLTESQLKKLPVLHWQTSIPQDTCSICIDNFEEGEIIRVLPCSHVFHKVCIDPWLILSSRRCPNCKGKVVFPNEHLSDSSNSDSDSHMEDSDDEFGGNERTPLLRNQSDGEGTLIEDTRFMDTLTESHKIRIVEGQSRDNSSSAESSNNRTCNFVESACLVDVSSEAEQISDDSFGSFQSANMNMNDTLLIDVDCSPISASVKSFDSDTTVMEDKDLNDKPSSSSAISNKKNEEFNSSVSSSASFFSCQDSELEKSTNSKSHELFLSFPS